MSVTLGDGFFGVTIAAGVVLCWVGYYTVRTWDEPGVKPFVAFTVLLGAGGILAGLVGVAIEGPADGLSSWALVGLLTIASVSIPWILFALQYTGQYTRITWRTVGLVSLPILPMLPLTAFALIGDPNASVLARVLGTIGILYTLGLLIVGGYLLVQTAMAYDHLSVLQGLSLSLVGLVLFFAVNFSQLVTQNLGESAAKGMYAACYVLFLGAIGAALFRYETFEITPAVGTIGERAIARESDDLIFVVDGSDRVVMRNEPAAETLDTADDGSIGDPLAEHLEFSVEELQSLETVDLPTTDGKRKFDPQVSAFTDQHDRQLGSIVSLRDVTERELRKQRLEVLNRVLRHNLRNHVDVIRANAEVLANGDGAGRDDHATSIIKSADELTHLGRNARSIDRFLSRPTREEPIDLSDAVDRALDATDAADVEVTVSGPESAPLVTDREAVDAVLESALGNALAYAERSVTVTLEPDAEGYVVEISDDGSGIPDVELASLDAETETALQHGTGLGLWQLKWGVTKLGGDLSFDTQDGTSVRITVPDRDASSTAPRSDS